MQAAVWQQRLRLQGQQMMMWLLLALPARIQSMSASRSRESNKLKQLLLGLERLVAAAAVEALQRAR